MSFKDKFSLIASVMEGGDIGGGSESDLTTHMPKKDTKIVPSEVTDSKDITDALDRAAEDEEVETITFGLEDENDDIVKVYVNIQDADGFEDALSKLLGDDDSIEDILDELSKEYDIVNVVWPEDGVEPDHSDFDEAPEGEEAPTDGSESLNPNVNYDDAKETKKPARPKAETTTESLSSMFFNRVAEDSSATSSGIKPSVDDMDPDSEDLDKKFGKNRHVHFALEVMKTLGIPAQTLEFMLKRQPALVRDIRDHVMDIGSANVRRVATVLQIDMQAPTMKMEGVALEDCSCDAVAKSDTMKMDATDEDKALESDWAFDHDQSGMNLTYGGEYRFEFSYDEMLDLITALQKREKISFDGEDGAYVSFAPKGDGFIAKSSKSDKDFVLDSDTMTSIIEAV
jgi:hypothetical protein